MTGVAGDVLVAHQPAYLPWPGYFTRLSGTQRLVVLDHVQFSERGWQNRNTVADRRGAPVRLTVPVQRSHGQRLADTRIAGTDWAARHWRTLSQCYGKAPYWPQWTEQLAAIYHTRWVYLADLNDALTRLLLEGLEVNVEIIRSSTLDLTTSKTPMLLQLCEITGCRVLRVGSGALAYLDHNALCEAGIELEVATYKPVGPLEPRGAGSLLDTLLRHGPASRELVQAGAHIMTWLPEGATA